MIHLGHSLGGKNRWCFALYASISDSKSAAVKPAILTQSSSSQLAIM
ncbi:hypothetical protein GAGA_2885 [Paraglaciecola agarilytica NO2]|uniref:Uncharacterized protein n=1 Tax=Paraglaciecola agarilytica NO2 TaxID=1125747 RepID=A0ABQ0I8M2_9ALTE|nr:hypothetical protein GAGA_2885 [Paraglaciecola agarilytica NO2]